MEELLLNEIKVDIENCEYGYIPDYEIILDSLVRIFGYHEVVIEIETALNKLIHNTERNSDYYKIKEEVYNETSDDWLANEFAEEAIRESRRIL